MQNQANSWRFTYVYYGVILTSPIDWAYPTKFTLIDHNLTACFIDSNIPKAYK